MSGQIKCNTESLLPSFDVVTVKLVALLNSTETCVLQNNNKSLVSSNYSVYLSYIYIHNYSIYMPNMLIKISQNNPHSLMQQENLPGTSTSMTCFTGLSSRLPQVFVF